MTKVKLKEKLSRNLDIPTEAMGNYKAIITNNMVEIENFKGILEYDEGFIKLKIGDSIATLSGQTLEILEMTDETIQIRGHLQKICL